MQYFVQQTTVYTFENTNGSLHSHSAFSRFPAFDKRDAEMLCDLLTSAPYEVYTNGKINRQRRMFTVVMHVRDANGKALWLDVDAADMIASHVNSEATKAFSTKDREIALKMADT